MAALDDAHLGALIRSARLHRGLGLREAAQLAGLSHSTLSKVESGTRAVRGVELVRIAAALGIGVDELVSAGDRISLEVSRTAALAAAEDASAAIAAWVAAADRAVELDNADLKARFGPTGPPVASALALYMPATREVGVRADRVAATRRAVEELARRVVIVPLPD